MSSEDSARPGGSPPRPSAARPAAAPRPGAPGPRPGGPAARPTARPPTGGKASWSPDSKAPGPAPAAPAPAEPPKNLQMVPLTGEAEDDAGPQHSATSFFAMPTPKKKPKVDDDPEIVVSAPKSAPAPPPGPPPAPPPGMMPPGMAPGMPMGGYPMQMGIQGPVAAGPMAGAYGRPPIPDTTPETERAQSFRVIAIVAGLLILVMGALAVCVLLVVAAVVMAPGASSTPDRTPVAVAPMPNVEPEPIDDPVPIPPPQPQPTRRTGGGTPGPRPAPAPAAPAPPPPSATGTVTVNIPPGITFTGVEVSCNDGAFRERGSFVGTTATVANVPGGTECSVIFKGGFPTKSKARAGQTLNCQFPNNQAFCQ